MTFGESTLVALFCMSMVFLVLACLYGLLKLFSYGIALIERRESSSRADPLKPAAHPAAGQRRPAPAAEATVAKQKEAEEEEKAVVMAAVGAESGIPLSELDFKSIRPVGEGGIRGKAVLSEETLHARLSAPPKAPMREGNKVVLRAPMPGTVLEVKTAVGKPVKKDDVILLLEALKMENEISAPTGGIIAKLPVSAGNSVTAGDVLAVIR